MPLFKSSPNLTDNEKARIEYHLQQIVDSIGRQRIKLPVLSTDAILHGVGANPTIEQVKGLVGKHLDQDTSEVRVQTRLLPPEKSGGGG